MSEEIKPTTESAKAVREVAKTAGKAIDAGRNVGGWLDRIFGRAIEDTVGLLWTDRISARRIEAAIFSWERLELLLQKTKTRLNEKGITTTRTVPPKIALPLLENATMEEDEDLHTLWSNLLASALDANADQVHRKYVSTLAEMTREDARVMEALYREWERTDKEKWDDIEGVKYGPGIDAPRDAKVSVITLNRLGLIAPSEISFQTYEPAKGLNLHGDETDPVRVNVVLPSNLEVIVITEFGDEFCRAVIR